MAYINVDIDVHHFLDSCSDRAIREIKDWLYENKELDEEEENQVIEAISSMTDDNWNHTVIKLLDKKWQLSKEDEETIIRISKQLY